MQRTVVALLEPLSYRGRRNVQRQTPSKEKEFYPTTWSHMSKTVTLISDDEQESSQQTQPSHPFLILLRNFVDDQAQLLRIFRLIRQSGDSGHRCVWWLQSGVDSITITSLLLLLCGVATAPLSRRACSAGGNCTAGPAVRRMIPIDPPRQTDSTTFKQQMQSHMLQFQPWLTLMPHRFPSAVAFEIFGCAQRSVSRLALLWCLFSWFAICGMHVMVAAQTCPGSVGFPMSCGRCNPGYTYRKWTEGGKHCCPCAVGQYASARAQVHIFFGAPLRSDAPLCGWVPKVALRSAPGKKFTAAVLQQRLLLEPSWANDWSAIPGEFFGTRRGCLRLNVCFTFLNKAFSDFHNLRSVTLPRSAVYAPNLGPAALCCVLCTITGSASLAKMVMALKLTNWHQPRSPFQGSWTHVSRTAARPTLLPPPAQSC
jgi:hypothetical protein